MKYRKRDEKLKLFREHGLGKKPASRVADSLGITQVQLERQCIYYGFSTAYKNFPWSDSDVNYLIEYRAAGMYWREIAEKLGRPLRSCTWKHSQVVGK